MAKSKLQSKKVTKVAAILILGVLLFGSLLCLISFSKSSPKFLDKRIVYFIDNLFAQIPFTPKTPRQILVRSTLVNKKLTSYKMNSDLKVGTEKIKFVDIQLEGAVLNPGTEKTQSQLEAKGHILYPISADFDFETFSSGHNIYFKVNKGVNLPGFTTNNLKSWHQFDSTKMEKDLKVNLRGEQDISNDINQELQTYLEQILKQDLKSKESSKDNKDYYEITAKLKGDYLTKIFFPGSKDDESKITLLVEKGSYFLSELKLERVDRSKASLSFSYKVTSQNQKFGLSQPKDATKINSPVDLYLLVTSGEKPSAQNLLKALGGEVKEVDTSLLTIERLTKVLLLLPKSF